MEMAHPQGATANASQISLWESLAAQEKMWQQSFTTYFQQASNQHFSILWQIVSQSNTEVFQSQYGEWQSMLLKTSRANQELNDEILARDAHIKRLTLEYKSLRDFARQQQQRVVDLNSKITLQAADNAAFLRACGGMMHDDPSALKLVLEEAGISQVNIERIIANARFRKQDLEKAQEVGLSTAPRRSLRKRTSRLNRQIDF